MKHFFFAFIGLLAILAFASPRTSAQSFSVNIVSAHCDYVQFSYNTGIDGGMVNFSTSAGGTSSATSSGSGTLVITFAMQSLGTAINVTMTHSVTAQTTTSDSVNCTNTYGGEPTVANPSSVTDEPIIPPWEGASDGRINPDPAEYYTIYCQNDSIDVVVTEPENRVIKQVSLAAVIAMNEQDVMDLGDNMTLVRNTADTITIYGSNGNTSTNGEKAFSLAACVESNGGLPNNNSESQAAADDENQPVGFFELLLGWLLDEFLSDDMLSSFEILFLTFVQCMTGLSVAAVVNIGGLRFYLHRLKKGRQKREELK